VSRSASGDRSEAEARPDPGAVSETAAVRAAVSAVRGGDRQAFGHLVERYQRRLFGLALMVVRDPSVAEELAQDAFVRALTHLDAYDERRPFFPWLATIAVRLSQNWLGRRARISRREGAELDPNLDTAASPDPLEQFVADEGARRLWRQVASLPSGQRTAVVLHYREEMKVKEIARALGVTNGTVKTLLFRARRRLRQALADAGMSRDQEKTT
jgi:RNA polymerase sigma-70 factor (ECF subfamily)